ncbi:VCBS domain-containing protein, partial [Oleiphilus sp. HI0132]
TGSIDEHGNWRYELNTNNPKVISLGEKERLFDTFVVESVDGTTQTVIIKIEGSDQPLFANNSSSKPETLELNQVLHDDTENDLESVFGKANSSHQSTGETLDNANTSASEILQQITQQNLQDNNLIT